METTILTPQAISLTEEEINLLKQQAESVRAEKAALQGTTPEQIIEFWLDYQQSRKPELNAAYPDNKQGKTVKDCYQYIMAKVRKQTTGNQNMIHHEVVFAWAEEYFIDDTIQKFEEKVPARTTVSRTTETKPLSKEEQQKKHDEWEEQNKKSIEAWNNAQKRKINDWETKHKKEITDMLMDMFTDPKDLETKRAETNPYLNEQCPYLNSKNPYSIENK